MRNLWFFALILPLIRSKVLPENYFKNVFRDIFGSFVPRSGWGARPPTQIENMSNPIPYVVIHHTYIPGACYTYESCVKAMQWMQDYHQFNHSWADIGYNFAVGGDGRIYEGRGWSRVGAHAPGYNNQSIGIAIIGDWRVELPPEYQLQKVRELIKYGVETSKIMQDYKLVGHRQVRNGTECPGDRLFEEIKTWPHWDPTAEPPQPNNYGISNIITNNISIFQWNITVIYNTGSIVIYN